MEIILFVIILAALALPIALAVRNFRQSELLGYIKSLPDFVLIEHLASPNVAIGLDTHSRKIGIANRGCSPISCQAVPYSDLTGVYIHRAEGASSKISRSGLVGFTSAGTVSSISLAITFSNTSQGSVILNLFDQTGNRRVDDIQRQSAFQLAHSWHSKLKQIIQSNEAARSEKITISAVRAKDSVHPENFADQLERISRLRAEGSLSENEFAAAKQRILGEP